MALGLFSRVVESDGSDGSGGEAVRAAAFALARDIAAQSPVAVVATKANLLYVSCFVLAQSIHPFIHPVRFTDFATSRDFRLVLTSRSPTLALNEPIIDSINDWNAMARA